MVNEETAERVEDAIRAAGYSPNSLARGLKTRKSLTVGVLIPDLTNPFFPLMLRGIQDRLEVVGYTALIVSTDSDAVRERRNFDALRARQVDGFIFATARRKDQLVEQASAAGVPLVLMNRTVADRRLAVDAVITDDQLGIALAVDHLVGLGHTAIAHVAGPTQTTPGHGRREGFGAALRRHRLTVPPELVQMAPSFTEPAGYAAATELFASGADITAIVAANDLLALGCYTVLAERGLRCPEDISIVGFNDMPFADRFAPPLTTLHVPHHKLGSIAAELLLAQMTAGLDGHQPQVVVVEPSLVIRGSTALVR
jgi:LacI family transcriptional regulator